MCKVSLLSSDVVELLFEIIERLKNFPLHLRALLSLIEAVVDLIFDALSHGKLMLGAHVGRMSQIVPILMDHEHTLSYVLYVVRAGPVYDDA